MRHVGIATGLVVLWVALWGSLTAANVLSGSVVAVAVLTAAPLPRPTRGELEMHPLHIAAFAAYFLWALLKASIVVAATILRRRTDVTAGIVAVPLRTSSDALMTLIANTISLTPGTLTIEVDPSPSTLYVHVLHVSDIGRVRRDISALAGRAVRAFGSRADIRAHFDQPQVGAER